MCPDCGCKVAQSKSDGSLSAISIVGFIFAFIMPFTGLIVSIIAHSNAKRDDDERSCKFSMSGIIIAACVLEAAFMSIIIVVSV